MVTQSIEMEAQKSRVVNALGSLGIQQISKSGSRPDEIQITDVVTHIPVLNKFVLVVLSIKQAVTREMGSFAFMHDLNKGCVVFVLVNDKYVVTTKQHRIPFGKFLEDIPRGWIEDSKSEPAIQVVNRKVPSLLSISKVMSITPLLKNTKVDDSMRDGLIDLVMVKVQTHVDYSKEELQAALRMTKSAEGITPIVRDLQEVFDQVDKICDETNDQDWLDDYHSTFCVTLAEKRIKVSK
ncbi:hypothetical protein HGB07_08720 [Candidatus Roizmanbacteria bacterium]|nr:hypothetical protein [Candidatus Roizmanbacteria bacterium]